jgi:beta-hydroxylase
MEEIAFYDQNQYKFTALLQDNWKTIQSELKKIIDLPADYLPNPYWFAAHPSYAENKVKDDQIAWKTFEFLFFGIKQKNHIEMCPETWKLLSQIDGLVTAQFSLLEPGTHVKPHKGYSKMVLRSHLSLIIPSNGDMAIKVGGVVRKWEEGKVMVFDDSLEHEAWNFSDERRAVLMFDFAKPDGEYSAEQICRYKLSKADDPLLLKIAPPETWVSWYENGYFPELK